MQFPNSNATIKVQEDGSKAVLLVGDADIGQGSDTILSQIAAEAMGLSLDRVDVISADSDITPLGFGAYSSRVTLMGGNAAKMAGIEIKDKLFEHAADLLNSDAANLASRENYIFVKDDPGITIPWEKVAAIYFSRCGPLIGKGHYSPPENLVGDYNGAAIGTSPAYSFSASICEVDVDLEIG